MIDLHHFYQFQLLASSVQGTEQFESFSCWLCAKVSSILSFLPETPEDLTIAGLITDAGNALPYIGTGVLYEFYSMVRDVLLMLAIWKTLKYLAFLKFL
jgi:hypothetical protein